MFCRRLALAAASLTTVRCGSTGVGVKSHDSTLEDDTWLEAQMDQQAKEMTQEERYAAEKQRQVLKGMMGRMRSEVDKKVSIAKEEAKKEQQSDIEYLKQQVEFLKQELTKKK